MLGGRQGAPPEIKSPGGLRALPARLFSIARTVAGMAGSDFVIPARLPEATRHVSMRLRDPDGQLAAAFSDLVHVNLYLARVSKLSGDVPALLRKVAEIRRKVAELLRKVAELRRYVPALLRNAAELLRNVAELLRNLAELR